MPKTPNPIRHILRRASHRQGNLDERHIMEALSYIEEFWERLTYSQLSDKGTVIGLPHPYILPANEKDAKFTLREQYYWDSYFTALGLVGTKHAVMAEGMLENLLYIFKRFHFIPNASRMYQMSHSQPPMLTSYIRLVYEAGSKDEAWLKSHMEVAEEEYNRVWMCDVHPFWHQVYKGQSRYYDINVLHDLAEAESGWDMTPRFQRKCLDYLPIDLNSLLYKYEKDFVWAALLRGDESAAKHWQAKLRSRTGDMNRLMWHERRGFYFDYDFVKKERGDVWSLAGFFPMWAGMATEEQAARMVKNIDKFEHDGGLATTNKPFIDVMSLFGSLKTQWAYPNGWAPLHWIVIEGLRNYGYDLEAERIARKWLHTNLLWYERHGVFQEKYNVDKVYKPPVEGLYPSQTGFGWTNAVFVALCRDYLSRTVDS